MEAVAAQYGDFADPVRQIVAQLLEVAPVGALTPWRGGFQVGDAHRNRTRLIAAAFDTYFRTQPARHSLAV